MLAWPWFKFEGMYESWRKRELVEQLERRRLAMLNGMWSNGMADPKTFQQEVTRIEDAFNDAIAKVYGFETEEDVDLSQDPFFAASSIYKNQKPKIQDITPGQEQAQKFFVLE